MIYCSSSCTSEKLLFPLGNGMKLNYMSPNLKTFLRSPEIVSQPGGPVQQLYFTYRPAAGYIGCRNRFLGSLNVYKFGL